MSASNISDYWINELAEEGFTPESARRLAVKKLKKANVSQNILDRFMKPIEEIDKSDMDVIIELSIIHTKFPEEFMEVIGRDLSNPSDYMKMIACWD